MIERMDPTNIICLGGGESDVQRFVEIDFRIRQGLCPNGHGLMLQIELGQECAICHFRCNTRPDPERPS